ncbi:hypothetical protein EVAR_92595_1 [Eumeta japonica]|uniref:Uncharacterized protein n=1 Tax=Eumeta variegata TaxID=151549 RepID=A0A4C1SWJ5_EUMVA|nr:hypothetical protein EVAR_92595_1 [Eumeta japonica]
MNNNAGSRAAVNYLDQTSATALPMYLLKLLHSIRRLDFRRQRVNFKLSRRRDPPTPRKSTPHSSRAAEK